MSIRGTSCQLEGAERIASAPSRVTSTSFVGRMGSAIQHFCTDSDQASATRRSEAVNEIAV